jgi:hypothetical protein
METWGVYGELSVRRRRRRRIDAEEAPTPFAVRPDEAEEVRPQQVVADDVARQRRRSAVAALDRLEERLGRAVDAGKDDHVRREGQHLVSDREVVAVLLEEEFAVRVAVLRGGLPVEPERREERVRDAETAHVLRAKERHAQRLTRAEELG